MIAFELVEQANDGDHAFAVYECRTGEDELVAVLARTIRELYVKTARLREILIAAMTETGAIVDTGSIEEAIERTLTAAIPKPGVHPVAHLDVARNELAEALAHLALTALHGTVIPAPRIENKEIPNAPARGLDLLGLEDPPLVAVISETKASDEAASPPAVVGSGNTSLRGQFLRFFGAQDRLLSELNFALKHAKAEHQLLIGRAIIAHVQGTLALVTAPVLVRPKNRRGTSDFGTFRENPGEFAPARVRFSLLVFDGTLDDLARVVYERARG
jgi:hypothetical protein